MSDSENESQTFKFSIFSRFRPFLKNEISEIEEGKHPKCSAAFHKSGKKLLLKYGIKKPKEYILDSVFKMNENQKSIFEQVGKKPIKNLIKGFNCSLFFYGFPKSGKTHTAIGNKKKNPFNFEKESDSDGLLPNCIRNLFKEIEKKKKLLNDKYSYNIKFYLYEVLNQEDGNAVVDLLNIEGEEDLEVLLHEDTSEIELSGLSFKQINSKRELFNNFFKGIENHIDDSSVFFEIVLTQINKKKKKLKQNQDLQ